MRADAAIAACPDYEPETCRTALQQVLAPFGGLAWVKPGMRIAVKANLVSAMKPERAATTHPMLLRVLTEELVRRRQSSGAARPSSWATAQAAPTQRGI